ncbi:diguanylate cyclase [Thermosipho melanesiensis BI429]|uniref:Diguanylate cyclase n=1 Tax=Thermosipho melanesiensis (strain DSM 12029 / CIP 104789 / BI429) TaxID=391009 RepID=A6LKQ8_THEM4|nr:diguanylate cyclase [Thermosipho melanesiensis BI429]
MYLCIKFSCFSLDLKRKIYEKLSFEIFTRFFERKEEELKRLYKTFDYITNILEADSWSLLLVPQNKMWRFLIWSHALDENPLENLGEFFQSQTPKNLRKIIYTASSFYIEDVTKADCWIELKDIPVKSWVGIPLVYEEQVYAILNIDWYRKRKKRKTDDAVFDTTKDVLSKILYDYLKLYERLGNVYKDILTGLYNRQYLEEVSWERFSHVLFIDLDNFKSVNDNFGHLIGDEVLKIVTERMQRITKKDDLLIRFGGDEFLLFVKSTDEGIEKISERLKKVLSRKINIDGRNIEIGCSVGIQKIEKELGLEKIISLADRKMYEDKNKKLK